MANSFAFDLREGKGGRRLTIPCSDILISYLAETKKRVEDAAEKPGAKRHRS